MSSNAKKQRKYSFLQAENEGFLMYFPKGVEHFLLKTIKKLLFWKTHFPMFHENFAKFAKNMILNARQKTSTFFIGYVNIRSCKVSYLWLYCAWKSSDGLFGIFRIKSEKKFYDFFLISLLCEEIQPILGVAAIIARFRLRMSI